jgi:hypothetical protein
MKRFAMIVASLLVLGGCRSDSTSAPDLPDPRPGPVARGRTQMWTENCIRCHNARSPGYYSDREWQVAMHHMRVRCSITPKEYEAILGFLQSAN